MIFRAQDSCKRCVHYLGEQKCTAFPDEIPTDLWLGNVLHDEPYPNDNGVLFVPKRHVLPETVEQLWSGDF